MQLVYQLNRVHDLLKGFSALDFLAPLLFRLILSPVMIVAGYNKLEHFNDTVAWFDGALGLPFPALMAALAIAAELVGGVFLLVGLATRYVSVPLMVAMLVAALSVHWDNGWFAVAPSNPDSSAARPLAALGIPAAEQSLANSDAVAERLSRGRAILREHGHYGWLTEQGSFVILQNGIEFAAIYFVMLLSLFFTGGGRFLSLDYYIHRQFRDIQEG